MEATVIAEPVLRIGNTTFDSMEEYREAVFDRLKNGKITTVSPFVFPGFTPGSPPDLSLFAELGFDHPRNHQYYNLTFDEQGNPQGAPEFVAKYEGILRSGNIDDPIVAYPYEAEDGTKYILDLDGRSRLSIIAYIMGFNPEAFSRVEITPFKGTPSEAKVEMVRRNMVDHSTPLHDVDVMRAIKRFIDQGLTKDQISEGLGQDPVKWRATLDNYIRASENLIPELVVAWEEGKINRSAAFECAKLTNEDGSPNVEEQEAIAETVASGEKIKGSSIKKKNSEGREMRYMQTLKTLAEKFSIESTGEHASQLAGFLAGKRLKSKFSDQMSEIRDLIYQLRSDIDAELNPQEDEEE